jgi:hypothetical protein
MEELPDFEGLPEHDVTLQYIDERHGGQTQMPHTRALHRVEKRFWDDRGVRRQIVEGMWKSTSGFVPEYYHTKDTLVEDAQKCFIAHRRSVPCIDYQDRSKRIGNPAAGDRKALSKDTRRDFTGGGPKVFLCNFCPIQTHVDRMKLELNSAHQY